MKILVPDTNLLLHGKFIDEIKWNSIFENQDISIIITYTVLKEKDKAKYSNDRARRMISFFKKYEIDEKLQNSIPLIISPKKINWDSLSSKYRDLLNKNEADHQIIAEVIYNYHDQLNDVYLITADYTFLKYASELGIKSIDWLDDKKYKEIFNVSGKKEKKKAKLPDLGVYFDLQFAKEIKLEKKAIIPEILSRDDLVKPNVQYDTQWETDNPEIINNLIKSYNEQMRLISRHQEINFYLFNHCDYPYNDLDIYITTTLEKNFILTINELINKPCKPIIPEVNTIYAFDIPKDPQEGIYFTGDERLTKLLNLEIRIESEENGKKTNWTVVFHEDRIKHNTHKKLLPILLFIPDLYKTKKISFKINFTHKEKGSIKEQNLIIGLF